MSNGEIETTFRGKAVDLYGVPFDDLVETLSHLQLAFRHLLAARVDRQPRRGPLPTVVQEGAWPVTGKVVKTAGADQPPNFLGVQVPFHPVKAEGAYVPHVNPGPQYSQHMRVV